MRDRRIVRERNHFLRLLYFACASRDGKYDHDTDIAEGLLVIMLIPDAVRMKSLEKRIVDNIPDIRDIPIDIVYFRNKMESLHLQN